jgi:hypothetical protein
VSPLPGIGASPMTLSMASRPTDCMTGLDSAYSSLQNTMTEAFDKLYAAEFRRFVMGKIVSDPPDTFSDLDIPRSILYGALCGLARSW